MLLRRPARIGRPGLIGTAARTAVIAGTATAVSGRVAARQQERATTAQQSDAYEEQLRAEQAAAAVPPPPPAPAAAGGGDVIAQLERLAALKSQGILNDQEFEAQKARILGS